MAATTLLTFWCFRVVCSVLARARLRTRQNMLEASRQAQQAMLGAIQKLRGQDQGGRGSKIYVFVHAQGITRRGGGVGSKNSKILST